MRRLRLVQSGKARLLVGPEGMYSYYHPDRVFTGLGWDAQTASTLLLKRPVQSILILGLGGGTVARQCRALYPVADIIGVDINEGVIKWAYDHFNLSSIGVRPFVSSGQDYLRDTASRFDVIIDDMWWPALHSPKPVHTEPGWAELISSRLNEGGMYAVNLFSTAEDPDEVADAIKRLKAHFTSLREVLPRPPEETAVVVAGRDLHTPREAGAKLRRLPKPLADGLQHVRFLAS